MNDWLLESLFKYCEITHNGNKVESENDWHDSYYEHGKYFKPHKCQLAIGEERERGYTDQEGIERQITEWHELEVVTITITECVSSYNMYGDYKYKAVSDTGEVYTNGSVYGDTGSYWAKAGDGVAWWRYREKDRINNYKVIPCDVPYLDDEGGE